MTTEGESFLQRAYALSNPTAAKDLYNEWASRYDGDLHDLQYVSPACAVDAVVHNLSIANSTTPTDELEILDAGCGTGLVGLYLRQSKIPHRFVVDGLDLSPGMLAVAREKGVYRKLEVADLSSRIERADGSYGVVLCVGTLTKGHVGPQLFKEMVRVARKGGLIVATVHDEIWESGGYKDKVEGLGREGMVSVVSTDDFGIIEGSRQGGKMVVLRKQ